MLRMLILLLFLPALAWAQGEPNVTEVIVAPVRNIQFIDEIEALGTLRSNESVDLTSTVTELVTVINFSDGQRVKKGDILVEMDAAEELAQLAEEQSRLEEAFRQVKRLEPLIKSGAASKSSLDERRREAETTQARIDAIQSRINLRRISAPFDGVLGLRNISVGALAQPGNLITTIDDDSVMTLDFSVPSVFLSTLKPGLDITAKTKAFPNKVFKGRINSISSRVDPVTRAIEVRALFDNEDLTLRPGLLMQIVLQKNPRQTLVIPEEAIIQDGADDIVMKVAKNENGQQIVQNQKVEIGARRFGDVEILSGLTEGDQVITHGALKLRPGSAVSIMSEETEDTPLKEMLEQAGTQKGTS